MTRRTTETGGNVRRFRFPNRVWAWLCGYFWLPCPECGEMFGGHEIGYTKSGEIKPFLAVEADSEIFPINKGRQACCWRHQK